MKSFRTMISVLTSKIIIILLGLVGQSATALPGNIALRIQPDLLKIIRERCKTVIFITGTNGKTTTNNLLNHIIKDKYSVVSNLRGANMRQGVVSAYLKDIRDEYDLGIFEIDEGSFLPIARDINPDYILITNFFRDQLDRYGEIESTVSMVYENIKPLDTTLILNADDPFVCKFKDLGKKNIFYGVQLNKFSSESEELVETRFCPVCNSGLDYYYYNYGHLGKYQCDECNFENSPYNYSIDNLEYDNYKYCFDINIRDKKVLENVCFGYDGIYNIYNFCGVFALSFELGIEPGKIKAKMEDFNYKLGRMEEILYKDKVIKITLVKNPIGLTEVIRSISHDNRKKTLLFILNDNPADGRDVSWIWDAGFGRFKTIKNLKNIYCSGKRAEDMAMRIKYAHISPQLININDNMKSAIKKAINEDVEVVYVLPTYTAVFETRDIVYEL
ncbi:MAG: MurT ligase domain-containing protein, partial [Methanobacterium sp.]